MENTFEFIHNNQYSLSIRFYSDGFSFYAYDESAKLLSKKNILVSILSANENAIYQLVNSEIESQLAFKNIRLICESEKYTLIPTDLFTPETASDFLHFEHESEKNEKIIFSSIEEWDNTLVSSIPLHLHNAMEKLYPGINIEHHLFNFLTQEIKTYKKDGLHVLARAKILDILLLKNGRIELLNSFIYNTPEDFTYFVLNVFEKLSLDTETLQVCVYKLAKKTEIKELLNKYINEISFIED
ncbi:MAG: DUF3822 family protein [Paludibacter sp.]|nr:DUF3822 family protein [Paludibacter sp.]